MATARQLQQPLEKINSINKKANKSSEVEVVLQNLGGLWVAYWELNGQVYYQINTQPSRG